MPLVQSLPKSICLWPHWACMARRMIIKWPANRCPASVTWEARARVMYFLLCKYVHPSMCRDIHPWHHALRLHRKLSLRWPRLQARPRAAGQHTDPTAPAGPRERGREPVGQKMHLVCGLQTGHPSVNTSVTPVTSWPCFSSSICKPGGKVRKKADCRCCTVSFLLLSKCSTFPNKS